MPNVTPLSSRKADHIQINIEKDVSSGLTNGLERYRFIHQALPELNLEEVDLGLTFFGKSLRTPLLISSMTGGTANGQQINQALAEAAQQTGIAMGVGSQRTGIEDGAYEETFRVRDIAPGILLFANLGAVQLNYSYGLDQCRRAVEMIGADGIILHLNSLQEALQPEGDTRFAGLVDKIAAVCQKIQVPVVVKEVGWGISEQAAAWLQQAGVSAIDVAGAGGTSWSQVEMHRIRNEDLARVAGAFKDWGIPTAESIQMVRRAAPNMPVIASGGLRSGIDLAKCIALGAHLGGMAGPFLKAAVQGTEAVVRLVETTSRELQICMFAAGAGDLHALAKTPLVNEDNR